MVGHRLLLMLVISVALSSLIGCAAFRPEKTEFSASWPISKGPATQSISLLITAEITTTGYSPKVSQAWIQDSQRRAEKVYRDSGLFSDVKDGTSETDLRAEIHITHHFQPLSIWGSIIVWNAGFLLPFERNEEITVKTTLKNREGQELGTYIKKETYSTAFHIFLIFIAPFKWPPTVLAELVYDLHRATLSEAYGAGHLRIQRVNEAREGAQVTQLELSNMSTSPLNFVKLLQ